MNWNLRKAELKDKGEIENLFVLMLQSVYKTENVQGYEPDYLNKFFKNDEDWICVAESKGKLVGYLSIEKHSDHLYLDDFCVSEKYRNAGIGTELLKKAQKYATEQNIRQIRLHVEKSNSNAIRLYQRFGYKIASEKDSRCLMVKELEKENLYTKYKLFNLFGRKS